MKAKPSLYAKFLSGQLSKLGTLKIRAQSNIAIGIIDKATKMSFMQFIYRYSLFHSDTNSDKLWSQYKWKVISKMEIGVNRNWYKCKALKVCWYRFSVWIGYHSLSVTVKMDSKETPSKIFLCL